MMTLDDIGRDVCDRLGYTLTGDGYRFIWVVKDGKVVFTPDTSNVRSIDHDGMERSKESAEAFLAQQPYADKVEILTDYEVKMMSALAPVRQFPGALPALVMEEPI